MEAQLTFARSIAAPARLLLRQRTLADALGTRTQQDEHAAAATKARAATLLTSFPDFDCPQGFMCDWTPCMAFH
jgi:hypothetical protein